MELVERAVELSLIRHMLDACASGRGGVLLVSGAAATGKTALLRELGVCAETARVLFLQATASGAERSLPLGVMEQLLAAAEVPGADVEVAVGRTDWDAAAGRGAAGEGELPAVVVSDIMSICGILLEKSKRIPLVLCIDDVQHVDAFSLECLLYLARRSEASRILVVLGESSSFPVGNPRFRIELLRLPSCRHVKLRLLTRQGIGLMIAAHGEARWPDAFVDELHRLSGGNPLLVRALLDDQRQRAAAKDGAANSETTRGPSGDLRDEPVLGPAFGQAVAQCLYRSDTTLRHAAWARAVLGPDAWDVTPADLLSTTPEVARRSVDALDETGLFNSGRLRHEAVRPAVLRSMNPAYRARLEARAAQVLHDRGTSATALSRHLIEAEPFGAPWVLPTLLEAADRAFAEDQIAFALELLGAARDRCPDERQALAIKALLLRAGWRAGPSAGSGHLPELTAAALAGRLGAGDTAALVGHLLWFGQLDQSLAVLDAVERRDGEVSDADPGEAASDVRKPFDAIRLSMVLGFPGLSQPTPAGVVGAVRGLLPYTQGVEPRAIQLLVDVMDRPIEEDGERDAVAARAERMLQGSRLDSDTLPVILVALLVLLLVDDLDKAVSWCGLLAKEAQERRAPMWQALFVTAQALVETRMGTLTGAHEAARTALALVPPEGWGVAVALPLSVALFTEVAMGRLEESTLRLGDRVPDAAFHTWGGVRYLSARGHYHLAAGRPHAALDDFLECGRLVGQWGLDRPHMLPWRSDAAQACLALGDMRRARTFAKEQLARTGGQRAWDRGVTLRVLAATVPFRQRQELLEEAVDILRERGHRYELARATEDLARTHRELGNVGRARTLARTALRLLDACGVEQSAQDSPEQADADSGAEPSTHERSWPSTDGARMQPVDELSDAELRVATLAARGHTNRQIAEQLFITVSTVEQHLTRVYRKLNVRRRMGLAEVLRHGAAQPVQRPGLDGDEAHDPMRRG